MPDPSGSPPTRLARAARAAAVVGLIIFALWQLYLLDQMREHESLPSLHLTNVILASSALCVIVGLIYFGFWRQARRQEFILADLALIKMAIADMDVNRARAMGALNQTVRNALADRNEIPTDRILAVVNRRLYESDRDRDLLAAALATQVQDLSSRLDSVTGSAGEVIHLPSPETREAFQRISEKINVWPGGDTRGDTRGGRNYRE